MKKIFTPKQATDPGLGASFAQSGKRGINRDGTLNIKRKGMGFSFNNLYHYFIVMPWYKFFSIIVGMFVILNSAFAALYLATGIENINGSVPGSATEEFLQAFFFSAQTFTTVGYGALAPGGLSTNFIASLESMTGLLSFAIATGVLYGRFSRPLAHILFSQNAVIAPYQDMTAFMVRVVNGRNNQMMDIKAVVLYSWLDGPDRKRQYRALKLERDSVSLFPITWTIVHPIDEESPLYGKSKDDLEKIEMEVLILIQGYDDTFSQTVHTRSSYIASELVWNAKFVPAFTSDENGNTVLDVSMVGEIQVVS